MDIRRLTLYAMLTFVVYSLWTAWQIDYSVKPTAAPLPVTASNAKNPMLPQIGPAKAEAELATPSMSNENTQDLVSVKTDVLDLAIDLRQGDIVKAQLLDYPESTTDKNQPFTLLQNDPQHRYVANSNLLVADGSNVKAMDLNFKAEQSAYQLDNSQKNLQIVLTGETPQGLKVKKIYSFTRGSYLIEIHYELANEGNESWKGYYNTQLLRTSPEEDKSSLFHVGSFTGASYSNPGQSRYQKVSFSQMNKANLNVDAKGGWIAMQQHYFLTAWIPQGDKNNKLYTLSNQGDYTIGSVSQLIQIDPNQTSQFGSKLYLGPEITDVLKGIAPSLDLTIDYGWLWFLSSLLFALMKAIYHFVGNWGWSIVLVTVLIKLAFYRLSAASYKSMAGMRKLQPKLQALKDKFGDDKAKISQATMELYRQEKVNPLGGCLPILVQIPVFIALYWVLLESVELRLAPFIFWIKDLASADPYHVLPLIMGATMIIQQKLNPAPADPVQAKMMMFLPLLFTALFWNFPSGLVLYWIVNNTLSILQQWYITRKYADDKPVKKTMVPAK